MSASRFPVGLSGFNFFHDVCCDSSSVVSKAASTVTSPLKSAGQAVNNALGGTFIGSAVRAAGRATQTGLDTLSKATKSLGDDISKIPVVGAPLSAVYDIATDPVTLPLTVADDVVHGESVGQTITDGIRHEVTKYKAAAPYVESVVALVPGVGGMCASCLAVGVGVAEGQPIDEILVEAAAAQVPGGAFVVAGYMAVRQIVTSGKTRPIAWDTLVTGAVGAIAKQAGVTIPPEATSALASAAKFGSDIANGKSPKEAGIDALVAGIPTSTDAGKAFHAAVAVALTETKVALQGSKYGDALFGFALKACPQDHQIEIQKSLTTAIGLGHASNLQAAKDQALPTLIAKLQAAGAADTTPIVAAARAALGGHGVNGFNVAHGLMAYQGDLYETKAIRAALAPADQTGFDTALALHIGRVTKPAPPGLSSDASAGFFVASGAQTAAGAQQAGIVGSVAGNPGTAVARGTITGLEKAALAVLATGVVLLGVGAIAHGRRARDNPIQEIYPDGSGAPALVTVQGWTYSLDYLGDVKCSLVTRTSSRKPPKWAADWARKVYLEELRQKASPEWFEKNREMYA
jgi:hypothetical protein